MKGHLGALLTTGLAAIALALALLQAAVVIAQGGTHHAAPSAARVESNRYSAPGGRSGIPYLPFDRPAPQPATPEGRTPERQQEEHRAPPPSRFRSSPPRPGPQPARKIAA
jgi:hypothetical protein